MQISLHKNARTTPARTTPAVRAEIAASNDTAAVLAKRYGITEQTVSSGRSARVLQTSCTQPIDYKHS